MRSEKEGRDMTVAWVILVSVMLLGLGFSHTSVKSPGTSPAGSSVRTVATFASVNPLFGRGPPPSSAGYDEQLGLTFTQNFTSLNYNVTAVQQTDPTSGTGPAYLLDGLSNTGYWYQVGISWDWSAGAGFDMNYEVFNSLGNSVYPTNGGGGLMQFSGTVNPGDTVVLNMYFSGGEAIMIADDYNTGASAQVEYPAAGATYFVGLSSDANSDGFFSGLMTEWYHGQPYYSDPEETVYSTAFSLSSAWMWMDEFNANNDQAVFLDNSTTVTTYSANPTQLQSLSYESVTEYSSASEFVTGALSSSTSTTTSIGSSGSSQTTTVTVSLPVTTTQTTTVTTTVPTTTTQTATSTTTSTTTVTSVPPPVTVTTTQTQTTTTTQIQQTLFSWTYALLIGLLLVGLTTGYLAASSIARRPASSATASAVLWRVREGQRYCG